MQETWVQSLGWEDLLEKEMATHSSILAWKIPWTEKPGRLPSMGSQRVGQDWVTSFDWPLPVSLTIITLLILIFAIGLVTVSPQDWPPILRLSVGIAYVARCILLLGCYFLCSAQLTAPWLLCSLSLLHSPAFWLLPAPVLTFILMDIPHVIIQLQNHAPWTSRVGSPNPYSLLKYKREGVSWVPAINQMEETYVSIPLPTGGTQMGAGY